MKKILICGSNGLVGQYLAKKLNDQNNFEVLHTSNKNNFYLSNIKSDFTQLDISNKSDVKSLISSFNPDIVINSVAISNVDFCETEKELAWRVNVSGVENIIDALKNNNSNLIHLSTDYIFDGKKGNYTENDLPNPINYYGKTKLAAENAIIKSGIKHCILRPIVIFGFGVKLKINFPVWVIESLRANKKINCATDQISNPTYAGQIADGILKIIDSNLYGIYNFCGKTKISRYELAKTTAKVFGLNDDLISPILSDSLKQTAERPKNTTMDLSLTEEKIKIKFYEIIDALNEMKKDENS